MKRILCLTLASLFFALPCNAGMLDDLFRAVSPPGGQTATAASSLDETTIVKGLKEALATGAERAVAEVAKPDGYFGNEMIRILLPEKVQPAAEVLGMLGYRQQVDEVVLTMNRAAEKAAPKAASFFGDAIRQMTLEDARGILNGGDAAATDFFARKTRAKLFEEFKPSISKSMEQVGTVRAYREMVGKYDLTPLASMAGIPSLDLDAYVTDQALNGLFRMLAEEEKKIRQDPAARTTALLKKVFGGK